MRINLPVNISRPTQDTPVKSNENPKTGSAKSFFVHMAQATRADLKENKQTEEESAGGSADDQGIDPMGPARNISLPVIQSRIVEPAQKLSQPAAGELLPPAAALAAPPETCEDATGLVPIAGQSTVHAGQEVNAEIARPILTEAGLGGEPFVAALSAQSQDLPRPGVTGELHPQRSADTNGGMQPLPAKLSQLGPLLQTQNLPAPSVESPAGSIRIPESIREDVVEGEMPAIHMAAATASEVAAGSGLNRGANIKSSRSAKNDFESALSNTSESRILSSDTRQGLSTLLESKPAQENSSLAGDLAAFQDFRPKSNNSQTADVLRPGNRVPGASENSLATDTGANPGATPNASASSTALQFRIEGAQPDSSRPRSSNTEFKHDVSSPIASSSSRISEPANQAPTSSEKAAVSQSGKFIFELADRIQILLREGRGEIRIQLKPENLGSLEIRAESTSSGVVARITTESSSVKHYLENNLQLLQQNLQDQGLRIDRIQVTVQDGHDSQSFSGHTAQFGHAGSGQFDKEQRKTSEAPAGLADEVTVDPSTLVTLNTGLRFHTVA
jgi:flagellar hook-length control protein FliK